MSKCCNQGSARLRNNQDRKRQLIQDTRGSINDGAATLRNEWRSLQEEGPLHVNQIPIVILFYSYFFQPVGILLLTLAG